jgi:dipeptidyl-peptidase-4
MLGKSLPVLLAASTIALCCCTAATGDRLDFEILFGPDSLGPKPTDLDWSPDSGRLAFLYEDGKGKGLWVFDQQRRKPRLLGRENEGDMGSIDGFRWAPDSHSMVIESDGDLVLFSFDKDGVRRLTTTDAKEEDPKFSPSGDHIAFVRENDLYLLGVGNGTERRLTHDGEEDSILNGKTDWVYWEEIWDRDSTGFWWNPTGDRIAYYRFDEAPVESYPLLDYDTPYPGVRWQKYPIAGSNNPIVRVGVVEVSSGKTIWVGTVSEEEHYIARVQWRPDGELVVQRLNRDQDRLDVLLCDPVKSDCSTLHQEKSATWINLTHDLHFLPDGRFLWTTESSGSRKLWLHAADGSPLRELTPADWTTEKVEAVIETLETVVWSGYPISELGARHRRVFRQALSGGDPQPVTAEDRWSESTVSAASGKLAVISSRADEPFAAEILTLDGEHLSELPAASPRGYEPAALPPWEFLTIPGPGGTALPAAILRPTDLGPTKKYPAIMYHYGCPASQVVSDRWDSRGRNLWHKMMAQRGYVILAVDNLASNFFGKKGAERTFRRFGKGNLEAQLAGVRYLEGLGYVDISRIGLWGWSGGGANTLYSLLNSPGTWKAGVAGAPVTDWRLYDSIWTERYLDHPEQNPEGYTESSAVTYAERLEDALLLVHGTADDNVHPQNTMAMAARLISTGKPLELAIHPKQKHGFKGIDSRHFYERMTEFFDRHLR